MRCPVQDGHPDLLLDYCARSLHPDVAAILAHHMSLCGECRKLAEAQEAVWSALDSWKPPRVSEEFDERLYRKIAAAERRTFWHRWFTGGFGWKPAMRVALGCGLLACALLLESPPAAAPPESSRIEALEPEQVDRAVEDMEMLRQFTVPAASRQNL